MNDTNVDWVIDSIPGVMSSASYSLSHMKHLANGLVLTNLHPSVSSSKNWCNNNKSLLQLYCENQMRR